MVKWLKSLFKKSSYIHPADEAYMKGKLKAWDNPQYAVNGAEPIWVNMGRIKLPKFVNELAAVSGISTKLYVERFLVHCLYMEQNMQMNSGNTGFLRLNPGKVEFFSHSQGPKNPKVC